MKDGAEIKEKILLMMGILLISTGIAFNEWTLAALFSSDGMIASSHRIIIWTVDLLLISTGGAAIIYRRSLSREKILVVSGLLLILAGILNHRFIAELSNLNIGILIKTIILIFDILLIIAGIFLILSRKSLQKKNILLFGLTILFCFILFFLVDCLSAPEVFFKVFLRHAFVGSNNHIFVQDNHLGWKPKVNSIRRHTDKGNFDVLYEVDHDGFRKINNSEDPGFSIYFFGDSFTFGYGVGNKDNFPAIIKEKYLKENINVYNAGVNGYGIVQMFQRFLNIEDRIKRGDLIVFTPLADDILRNIKDFYFPYYHYLADLVPVEYYPYFDEGVIKYYKMESNLYNKLKVMVLYAPLSGPYWRSIHKKFIPDTTKEAVEMIKIVKLRTEMKGARFVLFFLPLTGECLIRNYTVDVSGFQYFDIIDFFPSQKTELDKITFNERGGHWNSYGHEIAAKAIVETLINNKIIDKQYLKRDQ